MRANSIFNKKVTLFGSVGSDLVIATDLFSGCGSSSMMDSDPLVIVEAKAVALTAEIQYINRRVAVGDIDIAPEPSSVNVTIGLFTIIKLFRIVNLTVESRGFCIPDECAETSPLNPCEFFNRLDFPMDIFAPPQRPEFMAGIVNSIPNNTCLPNINDPCCRC